MREGAERAALTAAAEQLRQQFCQLGAFFALRAVQRLLENPLALRLLEGDFADGDMVLVDAQNGDLVFTKAAALTVA